MPAPAAPPAAPIIDAPTTPQFLSNAASKFRSKMDGEPPAQPAAVPAPTEPVPTKGIPSPEPKTPAAAAKPEPAKKLDASENFKRLNADFDNFRTTSEKRIKELESQLGETTSKHTGEIDGAKKQLEHYETLVSRFYVEHSDKFKAAFDMPIEQRVTEAKEAVGSEKATELEEILQMKPGETRDRKVKELATDLDEFEKIGLNNAYRDLKKLQKERGLALEKSKEGAKQLYDYENSERQSKQQAHQKRTEQVFTDELVKFASVLTEFRPDEANPEQNKLALENIQTAKQWLAQDLSDPETISRLVLYAVKGAVSRDTDKARDTKIAALETRIQEMTAAQPGLNGGGKPTPGKKTGEAPGEKFRRAMSGGVPAAA